MGKPRLQRVEELFHRAADLAPEEQAALLDVECAGDGALRAAVEELLRHDDTASQTESIVASPFDRTVLDPHQAASLARDSEALARLQHVLDGYELLEVLGSGGNGVVFKARQLSLGRLVAVKMLLSAASPSADQLTRFRAEAEALARLQHPNIVQIYEVGEHQGRPYIVMECVPGPDLARALDGHPQPPRFAAALLEVLSRAIQAVHDRGIIHRDLKPANILLRVGSGQWAVGSGQWAVGSGQWAVDSEQLAVGSKETDTAASSLSTAHCPLPTVPKITDFGLARRFGTGSSQTSSGAILGTPSYMAPEQARASPRVLGPATDVYGLGAVLYEMLTGRPPFDADSPVATIAQVLADEPVSPTALCPALPRDLVTICLKCLEKEPRRRYVRAADLADELHRFLVGRPIQARPAGAPERVWRWCRRRPLVAALTATIGVLALALVVTVVVYQSLLEQALVRRLAQTEHALADTEHQAEEKGKLADDERRQLASLQSVLGERDLEEGDAFAALLRVSAALQLDLGDPGRERVHRVRIAVILQECPRLARWLPVERPVVALRLGETGCWLAAEAENGRLEVWEAAAGQPRALRSADWAGKDARPIALSSDGGLLAVASGQGSLRVWDLATGQPRTPPLATSASLRRAFFSDDNHSLLAHLANQALQLWDLRTGQPISLEKLEPANPRLSGWSGNGRFLFAQSMTGEVRVWQAADGAIRSETAMVDQSATLIALRDDAQQLAFVDRQNALWLQQPGSRAPQLLLSSLHSEGTIREVHWSPDHSQLLTVGSLGHARVWDSSTGAPLTPQLPHQGMVDSAGFYRNDMVVTIGETSGVRVWLTAHAPEAPITPELRAAASAPVTAPAAHRPIRLLGGRIVRVEAPATGAALHPGSPRDEIITQAAFSPDGSRVATTGEDHSVQVWDTVTGAQLLKLPHLTPVVYAAFGPDGLFLATATRMGFIHVWDLKSGDPVLFPVHGPRDLEAVGVRSGARQLVMLRKTGLVGTLDLGPDERTVTDLSSLAQMLSGHRVESQGKLVPLERERLRMVWDTARTLTPGLTDASKR